MEQILNFLAFIAITGGGGALVHFAVASSVSRTGKTREIKNEPPEATGGDSRIRPA